MNGVNEAEFEDLVKQRFVYAEKRIIEVVSEVAAGMGISPERFLVAFAKKLYRDVMNFYGGREEEENA